MIKWVKQFINIHIGWDILSGPEGGGSRILLFIIQFLTFIFLNNVTTIFPSSESIKRKFLLRYKVS
jgi:hypothetical protein